MSAEGKSDEEIEEILEGLDDILSSMGSEDAAAARPISPSPPSEPVPSGPSPAEIAAKAEAEVRAKVEAARAKADAEAQAKARAEAEAQAKAKAEAEAQAKAKAQAEAQAKAKAQAEAQAKARAEAEAQAKARAEAEAPPQAAAAPESAKPAAAVAGELQIDPEPIPEKTPKDQIRRIAYLYSSSQREAIEKLIHFIGTVSGGVSKKPLYLHRSVVATVTPTTKAPALLEHLKKTNTAGVIAILEGLSEDQKRDLESLCDDEDIYFKNFTVGDIGSRTAAIEILLELMLLRSG